MSTSSIEEEMSELQSQMDALEVQLEKERDTLIDEQDCLAINWRDNAIHYCQKLKDFSAVETANLNPQQSYELACDLMLRALGGQEKRMYWHNQ